MKKIYVFENNEVLNLEPIVLTRPAFDLRCGTVTFLQRIQNYFPNAEINLIVRNSLKEVTQEKYPNLVVNPSTVEEGLWILGNVFWNDKDIAKISKNKYQFYYNDRVLAAAYLRKDIGNNWLSMGGPTKDSIFACPTISEINSKIIHYLWDAVNLIGESITVDEKYFANIKFNADSRKDIHCINQNSIYISSPDMIAPSVVIDASNGPVIIDKNVSINSYSNLQGPLFIGRGSVVQSHTYIRNCIVGPVCKVGGEISSTIMQGWSNKGHYGFLGNSYIGKWVNFGAGTTNSNLKNNYTPVDVSVNGHVVKTNELFIGMFSGDYSTFAIGTTLNTGTNIGTGCNIVTPGFPPKKVRSFNWLINGKHKEVNKAKFLNTAEAMQNRRGKSLSESGKNLLLDLIEKH